jgi:hypothetical protein
MEDESGVDAQTLGKRATERNDGDEAETEYPNIF